MPAIIFAAPGPVLITDGTNIAAVKPAATAPLVADPALVVALSPNAPMPLPSGAATEATLAQVKTNTDELDVALSTRASQATAASIASSTASTAAALDVALSTRASQATVASIAAALDVALSTRAADATLTGGTAKTQVTDGVNVAAVKAASVAPLATDPALVVSISPNSTISVSSGALAGSDGISTQTITARKRNGIGEMSVSDEALRARLDEIYIFMTEVYDRLDPTMAQPSGGIKGAVPIASTKSGLTTAQILLQPNTLRQTVVIVNDSTGILYLRYVPSGSPANVGRVTATNYTYKLFSQDRFEMPLNQWIGAIEGIWDTAGGTAYITEIC